MSYSHTEYKQRTDQLAVMLRCTQDELAKKFGVSLTTHTKARTGVGRISGRTWVNMQIIEVNTIVRNDMSTGALLEGMLDDLRQAQARIDAAITIIEERILDK